MKKKINRIFESDSIEDIEDKVEDLLDRWDFEKINASINYLSDCKKTILHLLLFDHTIYNLGHQDYYTDGYACGGLSFTKPDSENYIFHNSLLYGLYENFDSIEEFKPLIEILEKFRIDVDGSQRETKECENCNGVGTNTIYNYDNSEFEEEECTVCGGEGETMENNTDSGGVLNAEELNILDSNYCSIRTNIISRIVKILVDLYNSTSNVVEGL